MNSNIIRLPEAASTNAFALEILSKSRPMEGSVIITDFQTHGKGQDINTWESERGKNLTFSLILYPEFKAEQQFILNKSVSLGICDFLTHLLPSANVTIKWPNDIYLGDKKTCGILIQNSVIGNQFDYSVIGIGLNVNQTIFTSDAPNPVSVKMISGLEYDLQELLTRLLRCIFERYAQVNLQKSKKIETEYHSALYRNMEWHNFILKGKRILARITGTNHYGQLLLESEEENLVVCDVKDVKFII